MVFLFEITVAMHRLLWDRELDSWCQLWGLLFHSGFFVVLHWVLLPVSQLLLVYTEMLNADYPWCDATWEGKVWLLALGQLMLQSMESRAGEHSLLRVVAALERCPKVLCIQWAGPRQSYFALRYFPRIDLSPNPKPSMTFMIYGWNAGRIFYNLIRVYSCCFSIESVIPLKKN